MSQMGAKTIALGKLRTDGGTQPRASVDRETVSAYVDAYAQKVKFPPVVVFFDGEHHWLADGFHRTLAAREAGLKSIAAEVRNGSQRDAVLYSVGANDKHGLRRTNEDKRRAVRRLLDDAEWAKKSDRWIAEKCAVGYTLVATIRAEQLPVTGSSKPRVGKDGKVRKPPKARDAKPANDARTAEPDADDEGPELEQEESASVGGFDEDDALYRLGSLIDEITMSWPRTRPLAPLVECLRVKLGMCKVEAGRWTKIKSA